MDDVSVTGARICVLCLDLADERLWHGHEVRRLTPKAFAVLRCLTAQPGQLVTKPLLMDTVWPETAISESTLTGCLWELRQVLGDAARTPRYIETVHGRGYRFIAPITHVERSSATPATAHAAHRDHPSGMPAPGTLVGRTASWAQMHQWLATARQGTRQIGFITGEAGIGKTVLVDAFMTAVTATAYFWIGHGQCVEQYGAGEPYLPCSKRSDDSVGERMGHTSCRTCGSMPRAGSPRCRPC